MARCDDKYYFFLFYAILIIGFGMYIFKVGRDGRDSHEKIQIKDDAVENHPRFGKNFPI